MSGFVTKYVGIDRILAKLRRDLGFEGISESDVIEWTGEALEAIGAVTLKEEAVCFVEVRNHEAPIPGGLHSITQIARNYCYNGPTDEDALCANVVEEEEPNPLDPESPHVPVALDCNGTPINDYELAYYRPYFDLTWEARYWYGTNTYSSCFHPVRLKNHSFFNSVVCPEIDNGFAGVDLNRNSITELNDRVEGRQGTLNQLYDGENVQEDEYTIIEGERIRFSFQEGQVAIAYTRQMVDPETGYPLVPDHYSYTTAITKYITYKLMERHYYAGRQGFESRVGKAEKDWHWYCKQATNKALIPKGADQLQNILEQRNHMLPRLHRYYGFFGKMSRKEDRKFNDPDHRNYFARFSFRGYEGF